jgi:hypothetical protein
MAKIGVNHINKNNKIPENISLYLSLIHMH